MSSNHTKKEKNRQAHIKDTPYPNHNEYIESKILPKLKFKVFKMFDYTFKKLSKIDISSCNLKLVSLSTGMSSLILKWYNN